MTDTRAIYKDIKKYGQSNFTFELLKVVNTTDELDKYEKYYIHKFKSQDKRYGYNYETGGGRLRSNTQKRMSKSHSGLKESSSTKKKKSNVIIAINYVEKYTIISDSGKLLGDYLGVSKDYIKNCLRQPSSIKGFVLFYDDDKKRDEILNKMYSKRSIKNKIYIKTAEYLKSIENESVETIYELIRNEFWPIYSLEYSDSGDSLILKDYHLPYILEYDEELLYEDYWYENEY